MATLGKAAGAVRRVAFGGLAAVLVIGLAACGSVAAGAGSPAMANPAVGKPSNAKSPVSQINPGGTMIRGSKHVLLCTEIPKLTRMTVVRTPGPPLHHGREVLPGGFTIRDAVTVQRIAAMLCALPALSGVMSCPDLVGGGFRLFFAAPGKAIPPVTVQGSGCRVVSGLGPPRSWAASAAMQHEVSVGFGVPFRLIPPNA